MIGFKEVKEIESMDDIQDIIDRMQDLVEKQKKQVKGSSTVELSVKMDRDRRYNLRSVVGKVVGL